MTSSLSRGNWDASWDSSATASAVPATPLSDEDRAYVEYQVRFHQQALDGLDARLIPFADRVFHLEDGRMAPKKRTSEIRKARRSDFSVNAHATSQTLNDESELVEVPIS